MPRHLPPAMLEIPLVLAAHNHTVKSGDNQDGFDALDATRLDDPAMIELRDVSKRFGRRPAVEGLSLAVPRGVIYGMVGHNGAGKSTTIGMMLGQVWPTSGELHLNGCNVATNRAQALRKVGAIFETPAFYDYLSGVQNLKIFSDYTGATSGERIAEVVRLVGLAGREESKVRTYSHGMRTRLALAQALLPEPDLLILDEPSDGLDPEGIHEMRQTILRLHREAGLTILLSSHLLTEVEQLCSRICVLHQGRKVFEGDLAEATRSRNRARLAVDDFPSAVKRLQAAELITSSSGGGWITLTEGVGTDRIVRFLVEAGTPIHEILREERTLESFYLKLMEESGKANPVGGTARVTAPAYK